MLELCGWRQSSVVNSGDKRVSWWSQRYHCESDQCFKGVGAQQPPNNQKVIKARCCRADDYERNVAQIIFLLSVEVICYQCLQCFSQQTPVNCVACGNRTDVKRRDSWIMASLKQWPQIINRAHNIGRNTFGLLVARSLAPLEQMWGIDYCIILYYYIILEYLIILSYNNNNAPHAADGDWQMKLCWHCWSDNVMILSCSTALGIFFSNPH